MRAPLTWILAALGIVAVIVVAAAIGGRDKSGETVTAIPRLSSRGLSKAMS